jgi:hypothetical protein
MAVCAAGSHLLVEQLPCPIFETFFSVTRGTTGRASPYRH